jgi:hypothetical protein
MGYTTVHEVLNAAGIEQVVDAFLAKVVAELDAKDIRYKVIKIIRYDVIEIKIKIENIRQNVFNIRIRLEIICYKMVQIYKVIEIMVHYKVMRFRYKVIKWTLSWRKWLRNSTPRTSATR